MHAEPVNTHFQNDRQRIIAIVLLILVGLNAVAAGYSFIFDPSGHGLGMTTNYLKPSAPFKDYFIPGVVLFIINGIMGLTVAAWAILKQKHYPIFVCLQGGAFVGWIAIQLMMVNHFHPLHLVIGGIGLTLLFLGWKLKQNSIA